MDIKPIKNDADLKEALDELYRLRNAEPGTPEGDREEILSVLVEAYEDEHHPISPPDSIGMAKRYTYGVFWVEKEQKYKGVCAEFLNLSVFDHEQEQALEKIVVLVAEWIEEVVGNGEDIPEPTQGYFSPEFTEIVSKEMAYGG